MTDGETIAAIATAAGPGGIAIVRVSGAHALKIADNIFKCKKPSPSVRKSGEFVYGHVVDENTTLDEALLLIMKAPNSYTRENMVEIQGHGGAICAKRILRCVLKAGARPAEPGEFSKRAFLNGRIDLVQAEAVADLISAQSEQAATAALEQLDGKLSTYITECYDELLLIASDIESLLDFSDEDVPEKVVADAPIRLAGVEDKILQLIKTWNTGKLLREGILIIICGEPNVGKSTLFNALLGIDRAIVTDIPGTTRDTLEESFILDCIQVRLMDTAGIRETDCEIEQNGISRTKKYASQADIQIYIVDASRKITEAALNHIQQIDTEHDILLFNKIDLGNEAFTSLKHQPDVKSQPQVSLINENSIKLVKDAIREKLFSSNRVTNQTVYISERHRNQLEITLNEIQEAKKLLKEGFDVLILAASHINTAAECIAMIIGKKYTDDLLDSIFSRYCIGK